MRIIIFVLGLLICAVQAFAHSHHPNPHSSATTSASFLLPSSSNTGPALLLAHTKSSYSPPISKVLWLRGGQQTVVQEESLPEDTNEDKPSESSSSVMSNDEKTQTSNMGAAVVASSSTSMLTAIGKSYGSALSGHPIMTKSVTAGIIFAISDYLAQKFEASSSKNNGNGKGGAATTPKYNWTRTLTSMAVGLFYFGPAAHFWYGMIFRVFPGTSLLSILQKAAMGQLFFGPTFTCIFFATSLWQSGQFTFGNWFSKIKSDLPGAWLAGAGFWPLVDLVSFSFISVQYIPLFVNMCSMFWTIYLSVIANRGSSTPREE
eukprot:CAMPEP_0198138574 /NCGR_PEP_ID=MMETSP1443-20131203/1960_1 /TAXON_ID=186043 /ORGANISM="Entomoneis sp., Strain CCMP2396" /LENGTH=317 /DNA_ID=CAMNT_0043800395 /DNA_START=221 /DNA_END=1174 /DNA_ORIENTATION=-